MHPDDAAINGYVDEALDAGARGEVERHLASCARCRALAADLAEIRRVAASLELRQPPVRSWTRLERAIRLETEAGRPAQSGAGRAAAYWPWLAAAAALAMATFVGLRWVPAGPGST